MFLLWLRVATFLYAIAGAASLPAVVYRRDGWRPVCLTAAVAAFFFQLVSLVEALVAAKRWAPGGMPQVESLLALSICGVFLLTAFFYRTLSFGIFALPLCLLLLLGPALGPQYGSFRSSLVRGRWLLLHICALLTAYAALFFSLLANLLSLLQERRLKRKNSNIFSTWLPPLATMDRVGSAMLLIGFPFMTVGLLAGALIAEQSVGAVYFLDPKILLSFGMWMLYSLMLIVRGRIGLRGRRAVYLSSFGFLLVLSVWAANQLSSVHRFPAP